MHILNKKVLIISFYFPPANMSSGYLRALKFATYLPEDNFVPYILTVNSIAYEQISERSVNQMPDDIIINRTFCLDAQRHLSIKGKYPNFLAIPDKYSTWIIPALLKGLQLIYTEKIDFIFSTSPIPSAHMIGYLLKKITKRPWIADFRDPVWDEYMNLKGVQLRARKYIEKKSVLNSDLLVMTTDGIKKLFLKRYPFLKNKKLEVIPNGYDENDFKHIYSMNARHQSRIKLIHAGLLEQIDRDPVPFFKSVSMLLKTKKITESHITINLYAPGNDDYYKSIIKEYGIENIVKIQQRLPYTDILREMFNSDVLLLFQGPSCDTQIPAKLYEYLRISKPIFALTSESGETGKIIKKLKAGIIVPPDQPETIALRLNGFIHQIQNNVNLPTASREEITQFSRAHQTKTLVNCFKNISSKSGNK